MELIVQLQQLSYLYIFSYNILTFLDFWMNIYNLRVNEWEIHNSEKS